MASPGWWGSNCDMSSPYGDKPIRQENTKARKAALKRAGIEDFRWHDLRHAFGHDMITAGVSLRHVQELMDHASITTTQIYTNLHLEHLRDAVNAPGNKRMN
jgi:integrase/recombinase XerD